jgi:acylphosphatase
MLRQLQMRVQGHVQGVGFRATTKRIANQLHLVGYAKNCQDGTVEIIAQGQEQDLNELIEHLKRLFGDRHIHKMDITFADTAERFADFQIR